MLQNFQFCFAVFVRWKVTINENVRFIDYGSRFQLPIESNWPQIGEIDNDVTICWHDIMVKSFWCSFGLFFKISYWSKFHVNITGSGFMKKKIHKGLRRNREIRNTPVCVLPNIWRLGHVRNTKFGTNCTSSHKKSYKILPLGKCLRQQCINVFPQNVNLLANAMENRA